MRGERVRGRLGYIRIGVRIFYTPELIAEYLERDAKRLERFLILEGVPHAEVVRRTGVPSGTVSVIRQVLKAQAPLYRNTEIRVCVPSACPNSSDEAEVLPQVPEKIGGPGRTRTCDNTVMSGAF